MLGKEIITCFFYDVSQAYPETCEMHEKSDEIFKGFVKT